MKQENIVHKHMRAQHGLVTLAQAMKAGMTMHQVKYRLRTQQWVAEARGVYRHATTASTPLSHLLAVCLSCNAIASHRSAAALHAIDGYRLDHIEVMVPSGRGLLLPAVTVHETTQMESLRTVFRQGVPVTSIGRTIIDLAAVVSQTKLNRTIDAVLRDRLLRPSDLHKVLMSHARRGRNGSANLRAALCDYLGDDPVPLSEWSRMVEALLIDHGLDRPRLEYRIHAPDSSCPARVDGTWGSVLGQAGGPVVDQAWSSVVDAPGGRGEAQHSGSVVGQAGGPVVDRVGGSVVGGAGGRGEAQHSGSVVGSRTSGMSSRLGRSRGEAQHSGSVVGQAGGPVVDEARAPVLGQAGGPVGEGPDIGCSLESQVTAGGSVGEGPEPGSLLAQVDLAYPDQRVAIELDSVRWHHNQRSFVEDRRRRNRLLLAGWNVLNFTWDDYVNRPADLCAQVKAACTHRPSG